MSNHLPLIGGVALGLLVGLGVTHWLEERAADAPLRAPMVLSTDVPTVPAKGASGSIASNRTPAQSVGGDRGRPVVTASRAGVYVLRGDTLRMFDGTTLKQRRQVTLPGSPASQP